MTEFYTNDYIRKLLIESPRIRAKLENPGGSIIQTGVTIDTEMADEYSTQIGSGPHLDLIEAEIYLRNELPIEEAQSLIAWATGISSKQAAMYYAVKGSVIRKRRERGIDKLTKRMNTDDGEQPRPRENGGRDTEKVSRRTRRFS